MITFVTWKWRSSGGRPAFSAAHVNVLRAMIARHYQEPHRLVCITDDTSKLDPRVEAFPMPDTKLEHLVSPHTGRARSRMKQLRLGVAKRQHFPSCYRRLWTFSREAAVLGERLFLLDIDCIVTGDLAPLVQHDVDFVGWCTPEFGHNKVAGGAWLLKAGSHPEVWEDFDPDKSPDLCTSLGLRGSDQAWLSHKLYPPAARWTSADGVVKINWLRPGRRYAGKGVRLVFTAGHSPPWFLSTINRYPWVREHWRL